LIGWPSKSFLRDFVLITVKIQSTTCEEITSPIPTRGHSIDRKTIPLLFDTCDRISHQLMMILVKNKDIGTLADGTSRAFFWAGDLPFPDWKSDLSVIFSSPRKPKSDSSAAVAQRIVKYAPSARAWRSHLPLTEGLKPFRLRADVSDNPIVRDHS
jgi:hypothetical protein